MDIEILCLCEYAFNDTGRLNIIQTFDSLNSDVFPFSYDCFVAGKIVFTEDEGTKHKLEFKIKSHVNNYSYDFGCQDIILNQGNPIYPRSLNFIGKLSGFSLPNEGTYYIELWVNEELQRKVPFYTIRQV